MSKGTPQTPAAGKYIPIPADFPVSWENPGDAKLTWMLNTRSKTPMEPLTYAIAAAFTEGGNPGYERAGLPFQMRVARINTYEYMGVKMTAAPPDAVMKAMGLLSRAAPGMFKMMMNKVTADMSKQQLDAVSPIIARFDQYWYDELLPEIKQHIAYFESCNLRGMSLNQLQAHLAEALKRVERMGALHMLAVLPGFFAMSHFEELYVELFEGSSTLDALKLLQGFDNKTIEADRALWRLSRTAVDLPEVKEILTHCNARDVLSALDKTVPGRRFLASLHAWLHQYGQRLSSAFALSESDWVEDPTVVIEYLKAYVGQPDDGRETEQAARAAEREKAVADARARLKSYPQPVLDQFETLLKAAQTAAVVHEDHNYWIDQRLFYHVRQIIQEFGRRLAETRALDEVDDVFYLTPEELYESRVMLPEQNEEKARNTSLQQRVNDRKSDMEHYRRVSPPPMLGTMPPFEMDDGGPVLRAFFKGDFNPQENGSSDPSVVNGLAGSAGIVRGKARVIRSLAEAGKLQKGDILVTEFTVPPWTPLFATAGAIVTDIGGVLSHSAVVAREYRIPAVVGTGHATTTFHDGQLLEVDGNAGMVRAVASP